MTLTDMQQEAWDLAEDKGLHSDLATMEPRQTTMIRLALMHTEVTEALNELTEPLLTLIHLLTLHRQISQATQVVKRRGVTEDSLLALADELADIVIRTGDLAGCLGIDLDAAVTAKMAVNRGRPYKFGTPEEGTTHE